MGKEPKNEYIHIYIYMNHFLHTPKPNATL